MELSVNSQLSVIQDNGGIFTQDSKHKINKMRNDGLEYDKTSSNLKKKRRRWNGRTATTEGQRK